MADKLRAFILLRIMFFFGFIMLIGCPDSCHSSEKRVYAGVEKDESAKKKTDEKEYIAASEQDVKEGLLASTEGDNEGADSGLEPQEKYSWKIGPDAIPLVRRIPPPEGFSRIEQAPESFGSWLRHLPTRPNRPKVRHHDGSLKAIQTAHYLIIDIDTGKRDLQQCADAIIRLRGEWLFSIGREEEICFRFTSGDEARWTSWREGERASVRGNDVSWNRSAAYDGSYSSFRRYMDLVFIYAGSWSLQRELRRVDNPLTVMPGDVLIHGAFPGHAVIVLDVAEDTEGRRVVIMGQSYMPAQDFHVLVNPGSEISPWYPVSGSGPVNTPEWKFDWNDLMRFMDKGCPPFREP